MIKNAFLLRGDSFFFFCDCFSGPSTRPPNSSRAGVILVWFHSGQLTSCIVLVPRRYSINMYWIKGFLLISQDFYLKIPQSVELHVVETSFKMKIHSLTLIPFGFMKLINACECICCWVLLSLHDQFWFNMWSEFPETELQFISLWL